MSKFTPGPWEWVEDTWRGGYTGIRGANNQEVLFPNHCNDGDDGDAWFEDLPSEADRNLIAAAPEMYEALREVVGSFYERNERIRSHRNLIALSAAERALAKADGEVD